MIGGGAILLYKSQGSEIKDCVFAGCHSAYWGGAMYFAVSDVTVTGSEFYGCSGVLGGGLAVYRAGPQREVAMETCTFSGNQADGKGGAIYAEDVSRLVIRRTGIIENTGASGAGLYCRTLTQNGNETKLIHCTFTNNLCRDTGGAIVNEGTDLDIRNSIVWNNHAENQANEVANLRGTLALRRSYMMFDEQSVLNLVSGTIAQDNVIDKDPHFLDSRSIALSAQSPCIDQITDTSEIARDGNGDGIAASDIGAYEYPSIQEDAVVPLIVYPKTVRLALNQANVADPQVIAVRSSTGRQIEWQAGQLQGIAQEPNLVSSYPRTGRTELRPEYVTLFEDLDDRADTGSFRDYSLLQIKAFDHDKPEYVLIETIKGEVHQLVGPGEEIEEQLRYALEKASDGDIIKLPPNKNEDDAVILGDSIDFLGKNIEIQAQQWTFDCGAKAGLTLRHCGPSTVIDGFTFVGGEPALAIYGGMPTIRDCDFVGCNQAIVAIDSSLRVHDSYFGPSVSGANVGASSTDKPSSVYLSGGRVEIIGCAFIGLQSNRPGAAIMADARLTLRSCRFENNCSGLSAGGALFVRQEASIFDCNFVGNLSEQGGGAIASITEKPLDMVRCRFESNGCQTPDGDDNQEGQETGPTTINGGAVSLLAGKAKLNSCEFYLNEAINGGAIYCKNSRPVVTNGVFVGNKVSTPDVGKGGAVCSDKSSESKFVNCTIVNNDANGFWSADPATVEITNCIWGNTFDPENETTIARIEEYDISYSCVEFIKNKKLTAESFEEYRDMPFSFNINPQFQNLPSDVSSANLDSVDLRIKRISPCIDRAYGQTNVYSDVRGSLRPIDGDGQVSYVDRAPGIYNDFDIGAYEYSGQHAGATAPEDDIVHANTDIEISSIAIVGQDTEIQWANHAGFPAQDLRISQAEAYDINIVLVEKDARGNVLRQVVVENDLSIAHMAPAEGYYTYEVNYQINHKGTWYLRLEMANDSTQYWESDKPCRIEHRIPQTYTVGDMIPTPQRVEKSIAPNFDEEDEPFLFYNENRQKLYAVGPVSTLITWTDTEGEPMPILISVDWPGDSDVQYHVANTPSVELLGSNDFPYVEVRYADNDANLVDDSAFVATDSGYATLLFCESADYKSDPFFEVVKTTQWDDPNYLATCLCYVGEELLDPKHPDVLKRDLRYSKEETIVRPKIGVAGIHDEECGSGYVFFERAPYDASPAVYDRASRAGHIFAVNESIIQLEDINNPSLPDIIGDPNRPYDQLVVVWYAQDKNTENEVGKRIYAHWPFKAVRYLPEWPKPSESDRCYDLVIASEKGSDTDEDPDTKEVTKTPKYFETQMRNVAIYDQPDRFQPGFNPNEEHAFKAPAVKASNRDAVYALRADLNNAHMRVNGVYREFYTSQPFVLVRYQQRPDPVIEGEPWDWNYHVYKVSVEDPDYKLTYTKEVAQRLIPPNPLDKLLPYSAKSTVLPEPNAGPEDPNLTSWYIDSEDKELSDANEFLVGPFFVYKNTVYNRCKGKGVARWFYPLQENFWYDLDHDGENDVPVGTDIPWLSQYDRSKDWLDYYKDPNDTGRAPYQIAYTINWPDIDEIPELEANQTLMSPTEDDTPYRNKLPEIAHQAAVWIIHDSYEHQTFIDANDAVDPPQVKQRGDPSVRLMDFLQEHAINIHDHVSNADYQSIKEELEKKGITLDKQGKYIKNLPFHLRTRVFLRRDPDQLVFQGYYQEQATGEPIILPNVMSRREYRQLMAPNKSSNESYLDKDENVTEGFTFDSNSGFGKLVAALRGITRMKLSTEPSRYVIGGSSKALLGLRFQGTQEDDNYQGFPTPADTDPNDPNEYQLVTLAFNADPDPNSVLSLPVSLQVIKLSKDLWTGKVHRIPGDNVFDERSTLRHSCLFGGVPDDWCFEWQRWYDGYNPDPDTYETKKDNEPQDWEWKYYTGGNAENLEGRGKGPELDELTISGSSPALLEDAKYRSRYWLKGTRPNDPNSAWTKGTLNEGWVKRVVRALNPYDQRVKDYRESPTHTLVSMIAQLGDRYRGAVALNDQPDYLNSVGLIELYTTLFDHARSFISSDATTTKVNQALLFATSRIADFYMLLGNEAYADALDPTIGFSTDTADYGVMAPSLFSFQDFVPTLLDEELALLRGHDSPIEEPIENRLPWNFTLDMGEVAYVSNYGLSDQNGDGVIDEMDAKIMFPQAHGDAWGHYLMAQKTYYNLLKSSFFTWEASAEDLALGGTDIKVDYHDESRFAAVAAARAKIGIEILDLTFRQSYARDSADYLKGFPDLLNQDEDPNNDRHWGVFDWACRAGQGAYFDWVVGNALLYEEDNLNQMENRYEQDQYVHVPGMMDFIDRTTVSELPQIAACFGDIQAQLDKADIGLNPLGLSSASLSFDISPHELVDAEGQAAGRSHFEQIYDRALASLNNALIAFNYANRNTQNLRKQQDTLDGFLDSIEDREADFNSRLIEIYGTPYPEDIGVTGTYAQGYTGPDIYHYDYVDESELMQGSPVGPYVPFEAELNEIHVTETGKLETIPRAVKYEISKQGFGLVKPKAWVGQRRAPGELQIIRSDLIQATGRFQQLLVSFRQACKI